MISSESEDKDEQDSNKDEDDEKQITLYAYFDNKRDKLNELLI